MFVQKEKSGTFVCTFVPPEIGLFTIQVNAKSEEQVIKI